MFDITALIWYIPFNNSFFEISLIITFKKRRIFFVQNLPKSLKIRGLPHPAYIKQNQFSLIFKLNFLNYEKVIFDFGDIFRHSDLCTKCTGTDCECIL